MRNTGKSGRSFDNATQRSKAWRTSVDEETHENGLSGGCEEHGCETCQDGLLEEMKRLTEGAGTIYAANEN